MKSDRTIPLTNPAIVDRRSFLKQASAAALALSFPVTEKPWKATPGSTAMGIVVHSYASRWNSKIVSATYPGFTNAIDFLEHCHRLGAGGIQVVVNRWTSEFAKQVRRRREEFGMYLEGSISLPQSAADVTQFEQDILNAREAGVSVVRTVASAGRRYEILRSREDFDESRKKAMQSLQWAEPVLRKQAVRLAVENHKDWLAAELVEVIKTIGSEWVGVTLDFGNSIALLEDPMEVVSTLAPYAFSTHVKDMGVEKYNDGFLLSEVPLGTGYLDLPSMLATCRQYNPGIRFSLEMITRDPLEIPCLKDEYWKTMSRTKRAGDLTRTMDWVSQHPFKGSLPRVSALPAEERLATEEKNITACLAYSRDTLGLK